MWWRKSTSRFLQKRKARNETPSLRIGNTEETAYKGGIVTRSPFHEALRDIFRFMRFFCSALQPELLRDDQRKTEMCLTLYPPTTK
jgi:hypothetical protein